MAHQEQPKEFTIRQATSNDQEFIDRMCYAAAFMTDGRNPLVDATSFEDAMAIAEVRAFSEDFGKEGDFGLIAESPEGHPAGAAWYRNYKREAESPFPSNELTIAVLPEFKRIGLGTKLLNELMENAETQGIGEVCLGVKPRNEAARKLYEGLGFVAIGSDEGFIVMNRTLEPIKRES